MRYASREPPAVAASIGFRYSATSCTPALALGGVMRTSLPLRLTSEEDDNSPLCKGCRVYHMFAKHSGGRSCITVEHTPGSKGQMPCLWCNMTQFPLPAVLQHQRKSTTGRHASIAVCIQRASCCSCQHGLQVLCQLLHCDGVVSGHLVENINQLALLSQQVGSECCTPCQPRFSIHTLAMTDYIGKMRQAKRRPRQHSL